MQRGHGGIADFDRQIAARHHDAVADAQDFVELGNGFGALDLGDQAGLVFVRRGGHVAQLARHFHVGGVFRKADGDVIGLKAHRRLDVFHVLGGQRGRGQAAALLVDALVVRQLAAELDGGVDFLAAHRIDGQDDQAVVEQQQVARLHVTRQFLVVQAHALDVARRLARGVEDEFLAGLQHHLAFGELADADFRALQVGHDGHFDTDTLGNFAHQGRKIDVVLRLAVAEVQPHHVDPGTDHFFQQNGVAGGGAEGSNNFGGAMCHGACLRVVRSVILTRNP